MTIPDAWTIIKIKQDGNIHYRVFANFFGGYLSGDSWLLNSGIVSYENHPDYYLFHGESGSVYKCYKKSEKMTGYGHTVYIRMKKQVNMRKITMKTYRKTHEPT